MDKKAKQRIQTLRAKLQKLEQLAANARRQLDDPQELATLEKQINEIRLEIEKLKDE